MKVNFRPRRAGAAVAALAALTATMGALPAMAQSDVHWTADHPGARTTCAMAYDSARGVVVLFGVWWTGATAWTWYAFIGAATTISVAFTAQLRPALEVGGEHFAIR